MKIFLILLILTNNSLETQPSNNGSVNMPLPCKSSKSGCKMERKMYEMDSNKMLSSVVIKGYGNYEIVTMIEGSITSLVCEARGRSSPTLEWSINGVTVPNNQDTVVKLLEEEVLTTSHLSLPVSRENNLAVIKCSAQHPSLETSVIQSIIFPPHIQQPGERNYEVMEGDSVDITCEVTGNPSPYITWYRVGEKGREMSSCRKVKQSSL